MTSENFKFWLNGYTELGGVCTLGEPQVKMIKEHMESISDKDDNFINYLSGFFDSVGSDKLSQDQCDSIFLRLGSEFVKVTPDLGDMSSKWKTNGSSLIMGGRYDDKKLC